MSDKGYEAGKKKAKEKEKKGIEEGDCLKYGRKKFYRIEKLIGKGGFGKIFSAVNHRNVRAVVKVGLNEEGKRTIQTENKVYSLVSGSNGFPLKYLYACYNDEPFIAMKRCGCSVRQYFRDHKAFSVLNAAKVGVAVIPIIEKLHECEYLHRDIKPDNMLINEERKRGGRGETTQQLYLIDFGNSCRFRNSSQFLIRKNEKDRCAGTNDYASPNWHRSRTQSCKDDLLSLAYSMSYLCTGSTPWYSELPRTHRDHEKMAAIKENVSAYTLFPGCSKGLLYFYENIRSLQFHETPDYDNLIQLLMSELGKK